MGLFRQASEPGNARKKKAPPAVAKKKRVRRGAALLSRGARKSEKQRGSGADTGSDSLWKEIIGLALLGVSVVTLLSLLSYTAPAIGSGQAAGNWIGPAGAGLAGALFHVLGMTALALPAMLLLLSLALLLQRTRRLRLLEAVGFLAVAVSLSLLAELTFGAIHYERVPGLTGGGVVGESLLSLLDAQISQAGAGVLAVTVLLVGARLGFGVQLLPLVRSAGSALQTLISFLGRQATRLGGTALDALGSFLRGVKTGLVDRWYDWREERELQFDEERWERDERLALLEEQRLDRELGLDEDDPFSATSAMLDVDTGDEAPFTGDTEPLAEAGLDSIGLGTEAGRKSRVRRPYLTEPQMQSLVEPLPEEGEVEGVDITADLDDEDTGPVLTGSELDEGDEELCGQPEDSMRGANQRGEVHAELRIKGAGTSDEPEEPVGPELSAGRPKVHAKPEEPGLSELSESRPKIHAKLPVDPDSVAAQRIVSVRRVVTPIELLPYDLPELDLLQLPPASRSDVDEAGLEAKAALLERTLQTFKVDGQVTDILPGPVVTMFEFKPAPGIKVSRIAGLGDDLAMALEAEMVRIVAPIPGKGVVGIEVPSDARETVYLREVMASKAFRKEGMQLPIALGKAIDGKPVCADLVKMPHLLVAGSTGSGKSVCVNTVILSLLYRWSPEEVRLILVDPKMLEFSVYKDVPHLLVPVVTSPKKAAMALNWAVSEMYRRNQVLAAMHARNIVNYNQKVDELIVQWDEWEASCKAGKPKVPPDCGRAAGLDTVCHRSDGGEPVGPPEKMPYIVIVIDELSDLMMAARKEVEDAIVRLAQMARAGGIHLLLATQRPSTDVVTGLIKANFPGRMSFRVSSMVDSRTVLDANGAEKLLGNGDGLFLPPGTSDLMRFHGAFVSEGETEDVIEHIKSQRGPQYVELTLPDDADGKGRGEDDDLDPMYDEAVAVVSAAGKASTSLLQRRLKLGYNRAARIIDSMESQGVIGPADGARPREVFVNDHSA